MKKRILPSILFLMISVDAFSYPGVAEITIVNKSSNYDLISCNYNHVPMSSFYHQYYFKVSVNSAADAYWKGGTPMGGGTLFFPEWLKHDGTVSDSYGSDTVQNYVHGMFYYQYVLKENLVTSYVDSSGTKIRSNADIQPGGSFSTHFRDRGDAIDDAVVSCTLVPENGNGGSVFRIIYDKDNVIHWDSEDPNISITKDPAHSSVSPNPISHAIIDTFNINYG